jgi:hypothetical protein
MSDLERAKEVAGAVEWEGDARVNFMTALGACRVLLRRVEELEEQEGASVMTSSLFRKHLIKSQVDTINDQQAELDDKDAEIEKLKLEIAGGSNRYYRDYVTEANAIIAAKDRENERLRAELKQLRQLDLSHLRTKEPDCE